MPSEWVSSTVEREGAASDTLGRNLLPGSRHPPGLGRGGNRQVEALTWNPIRRV